MTHHHLAKPITIRGVTYPSPRAAAGDLGVSVSAIYQANRRNRKDFAGSGKGGFGKKPITIRGVTYKSQRDAEKALGVNAAEIVLLKRLGIVDCIGLPQHGDRQYKATHSKGNAMKLPNTIYIAIGDYGHQGQGNIGEDMTTFAAVCEAVIDFLSIDKLKEYSMGLTNDKFRVFMIDFDIETNALETTTDITNDVLDCIIEAEFSEYCIIEAEFSE